MNSISPLDLYELVRQGQTIELIDVRTPAEFQEVHADLAVSVPLDTLDPGSVQRSRKSADRPLYMICRSGGRSQRACELFIAAGIPDVVNVDGGTLSWLEGNLPVVWGDAADAAKSPGASQSDSCRTRNA